MIITPFQIFCYQEREKAARSNPHLKGIAVTALLGQMWRNLSEPAKEYYNEMSLKLRKNAETKESPKEEEFESLELAIPKFAVQPRGKFGVKASIVSKSFLEKASKKV